jgi:hypothetical protein
MKVNRLNLLSKGWSVKEIDHATKIIDNAEEKKHKTIRFIDHSLYWGLLVLLIMANFVCSIALIPFIFAIKGSFIIIFTAIFGFLFGVMFSILIIDIEKVNTKYNKNLISTLFLSGLVNFGLIAFFVHNFSTKYGLISQHNTYIIAGIYLFAFFIPHITYILRNKK